MKLSKILAPLLALCLVRLDRLAPPLSSTRTATKSAWMILSKLTPPRRSSAQMTRRARAKPTSAICGRHALRWFAVSGEINAAFDEDDVKAGNDHIAVDADHVVALWNGGNLRADIAEGTFGAEALAEVLPFPNKVAVVYMSGAQLLEALEAASQALPYTAETADACASLMQVSGLTYTVDTAKAYDALEAYGDHWFTAVPSPA